MMALGVLFNLATLCTVIECLYRVIHSSRIVFYTLTEERLTLGFNSLVLFTLFVNGMFEGYCCCLLSRCCNKLEGIEDSTGPARSPETEKVNGFANIGEYRLVPPDKFVPMKDSSQTLTPEMDPDVQARNQELRLAWLMEELGKKNSIESTSFSTVVRHSMSSIPNFVKESDRTDQNNKFIGRSSSLRLSSPKLVLSTSAVSKRKSLPPTSIGARRASSNISLGSRKPVNVTPNLTSAPNLRMPRGRSYTYHKNTSPTEKNIPSPRRLTRLSTITDISRSLLNFVVSSPSSAHNDNTSRHTTEQYSPGIPEPVTAKPNDISPKTLDSPQLQMERNALERINSALLPPYLHTPDTLKSTLEVFNNPNYPPSLPNFPSATVSNSTGSTPNHFQDPYTFPDPSNTPATGVTAYFSPMSNINSTNSNGNADPGDIVNKKSINSNSVDDKNINTTMNSDIHKPLMSCLEDLPEVNELNFIGNELKGRSKQWISTSQMEIPRNVTPEIWEKNKEKFLERAECLQHKIVVSSLNLDEEPQLEGEISLSSGTSRSSSNNLSKLQEKKYIFTAVEPPIPNNISSSLPVGKEERREVEEEEKQKLNLKIGENDDRIVSDTISELEEYLHEKPRTDEENEQLLIDSFRQKQVSADLFESVLQHRPVESLDHSPTRSIGSIISSGSMHKAVSRNDGVKAQYFHRRSNSQIQYVFPNSGSPRQSLSTQSSPRRSNSRNKFIKRLSSSGLSDGIRTPQMHHGNRHSYNEIPRKGFFRGHSRGRTIDLSYISALQSQESPVGTVRRLSTTASSHSSAIYEEMRRHSVSADRMSRTSISLLHLLHLDTSRSTLLSVEETSSTALPPLVPPEPLEERETIADISESTPDRSKDSDNTYPDIVMGQYDKEKWNTMLNVNLIDANGNLKG